MSNTYVIVNEWHPYPLAVKDFGGGTYQPCIADGEQGLKTQWLIVPDIGDTYRLHNLWLGARMSLQASLLGKQFHLTMEDTDEKNEEQRWRLYKPLNGNTGDQRFFIATEDQGKLSLAMVDDSSENPPYAPSIKPDDPMSLNNRWWLERR